LVLSHRFFALEYVKHTGTGYYNAECRAAVEKADALLESIIAIEDDF